jgi:hypothetical protein
MSQQRGENVHQLPVRSRKLLAGIAALTVAQAAGATTYNDVSGDNYGPSYVDIDNVVVTNTATDITFQINLNPTANLTHVDGSGNFDRHYGKYQIGLQTGPGGNTDIMNNFGNQIGISSGVNYSLLGWADNIATPANPGDPPQGYDGTFHWNGSSWDTVAGNASSPFVDTPTVITDTSISYTIPLATLGLSAGNTFKFDVWTTFPGGGQSAYDALGKQSLTTDPGTPYGTPAPYDSATSPGSTLLSYTITSVVTGSQWTGTTNGNWSDSGNWSGSVPNAADATANFGAISSGNYAIALDGGAKTVGAVNFDSSTSYTIGVAGGNALILQASAGTASINVINGNHTIASPVTLNSDLTITTGSASTLSVTSPVVAPSTTIVKAGAGTVQLARVEANLLNITGGIVKISQKGTANSAAGTSVVSTLFASAGTTIDLTNNSLVNNYTTAGTLPDTIRQMIGSGRIATSLGSGGHALGYADNATLGRSTFGGLSVGSNSVLIGYTFSGDANLDGRVNGLDFNALSTNFGDASGKLWVNGDFNYDGLVNSADFTSLAQNFNASMPSPSFGLGAVVPEPLIGLFCAAATLLCRRRPRICHPEALRRI